MNRCCAKCSRKPTLTTCGFEQCKCHAKEKALQELRDQQMEERLWAAWRNGQ